MVRVIVVGLGPIGLACAQAIRAEREVKLVGLVDRDPAKVGRTLADLAAGQPGEAVEPDGLTIADRIERAAPGGADVAMVTTSSRFDQVVPTLHEALGQGLAVVSSCEEMAWPWYRHAALAEEMDAAANCAGRALLGTGVNPGFVMDLFPVVLASMLRRVTAVRCTRRVDAGLRRKPLQAKVGATMKPAQFEQLAGQGKIGHAGLPESICLLAAGLGRRIEPGSVSEKLEAVIADKPTPSGLGLVAPGLVAGIHNTAVWEGEDLRIELDLTMAVGLTDPKDVIELDGPVQIRCKIPGSLPGDSATVAALLNNVRIVHEAASGLRTMLDVPPAGSHNRDMDSGGRRDF